MVEKCKTCIHRTPKGSLDEYGFITEYDYCEYENNSCSYLNNGINCESYEYEKRLNR